MLIIVEWDIVSKYIIDSDFNIENDVWVGDSVDGVRCVVGRTFVLNVWCLV